MRQEADTQAMSSATSRAPRWTPATLVAHLTEHLPAAWQLSALPSEMRHRSRGARLDLGDCRIYVAATSRRCSVLAVYRKPIPGYPMLTEPSVLVFYQPDFLPAGLLRAVRAAAAAVVALYPVAAPEWAKVSL